MALPIPDWSLSGRCFAVGTLSFILRRTSDLLLHLKILPDAYFDSVTSNIIVHLIVLASVKLIVPPRRFDVAWRALLLGCCLNLGLTLATYTTQYQSLGMYCIFLSIFHWSEFMIQSTFNPDTSVDSYMLYHSDAYVIAFFAALVEYAVELYMWPDIKLPSLVSNFGISIVIFGDALRKTAMWTAKSNFNHYVQFEKDEEHELVTHGVYALFRHPSYVGWFWWSVGTQLILFNPVCALIYALASWKFFSERIYTEEMTLIKFFGIKYVEYQGKVGTGIPFIAGFTVPVINSGSGEAKPAPDDSKEE